MDKTAGLVQFVRAVETGSFSAAARLIGTTPSAVSKSIDRLERRLGAKLFLRSTRTLTLTDDGAAYFERVGPLLRALEDAEDALHADTGGRGRLRVSLPNVLAPGLLDALTGEFLARHPQIKLELGVTDRHVDVIREGYDVSLRAGPVGDTELVARPLGRLPMVLAASPAYLARAGRPRTAEDLPAAAHLRYLLGGRPIAITFADGEAYSPEGVLDADSGLALRHAALNGLGIACLLRMWVEGDLQSGRLEIVLPERPLRGVPLQALHAFGRFQPLRVRLLLDFVAERMRPLTLEA
ncbi:LysR family transcriptional regulator [Caulobacter sp. 17J65-9]|uniref:LysR substrate-binding domain-containing protein n=1 Tax=Caulobacter sp. 17J65-9 TaxID=2709382 RepID=UPI0013CBED60|nr:LysR family transcriptional regulator [Caulobacter sp. 17J65-9]